jgi:phage gp29-like protein
MAREPQLLDRNGRPVRRAELRREVGAAQVGGVRSPLTGYPGDGLNPARLASILREADQGMPLRYFELAETIEERDLHYAGVLATRKRSVAQIEITVAAASDDAEDVARADMIRAWLDRDELADELFDILDAIGKGVSFTEILWDTSGGQWWPGRLEWRDPRWFTFDRRDGATPMLRDMGGDFDLPPFKFVTAAIKAKSGLPVRSGIARLAAWSWMFKAFTQRDWAIFTQTFGQPIRVGKYGPGATEEDKDTLFRAVANIAGDCAAIVPETMAIEFIEAKSVGTSSDLYEKRADWLDRQVSKAVLGQTATTDAIAGGHAVGQEHRQVQQDIERADARALSAILNRDLIRPWMELEFGPLKAYPRIVIARPEDRDVAGIVAAVEKLVPMGLRVQSSVMSDLLGLPDPDPGAEVLRAPAAAAPPAPAAVAAEAEEDEEEEEEAPQAALLAEGADPVPVLADGAEAVAAAAVDAMIERVRGLLAEVGSLEEFRARLLELEPGIGTEDLAERLRMALVFAELSGRDDIGG